MGALTHRQRAAAREARAAHDEDFAAGLAQYIHLQTQKRDIAGDELEAMIRTAIASGVHYGRRRERERLQAQARRSR